MVGLDGAPFRSKKKNRNGGTVQVYSDLLNGSDVCSKDSACADATLDSSSDSLSDEFQPSPVPSIPATKHICGQPAPISSQRHVSYTSDVKRPQSYRRRMQEPPMSPTQINSTSTPPAHESEIKVDQPQAENIWFAKIGIQVRFEQFFSLTLMVYIDIKCVISASYFRRNGNPWRRMYNCEFFLLTSCAVHLQTLTFHLQCNF